MRSKTRNLAISLLLTLAMLMGLLTIAPLSALAQGEITAPTVVSVGGIEVEQETNMGGAPMVMVGQPYSAQVVATGGDLTYSAGASGYMDLPDGLSIDAKTGLISGTCTDEIGRYNCLIKATNTAGEASVVIGITVGDSTCIPEIETAAGSLGETYKDANTQFTVSATDNSASMSIYNFGWSIKSGALPDGMRLSYVTSRTVYLTGTPTATGTFDFELEAKNDFGAASRTFSITVEEGSVRPEIIESGDSLGYGVVGKPYEYQLEATGTNTNEDPMLWSTDSNDFLEESYDLGNGLSMSKTGLITGTPLTDQTVNFYVYAKNSVGDDYAGFHILIYDNGIATAASITPEVAVVEKGSTKEFTVSLEGYGDVEQVAYWSFYMWDSELGSAFPQPTDSELSVNTATPSKTVTLTVGENEERKQIRVVAYSKPGNNGEKAWATVTIVEKAVARDNVAKSVAFFDTASDGNPECAINDITPYLVNDVASAEGTLGENGCTAYIDAKTGTLYLKDYNGGPFAVVDEYYNQLSVVLQGDNVITNVSDSPSDRYGIYSKNGLIDITSSTGGTLTVNVTNTDSQRNNPVYGIAAGFASGQITGQIRFSGNAAVTICVLNQSVYETTGAKTTGIFAYDGIYFLDGASVTVRMDSAALGMTSGLVAVNSSQSSLGITFNTAGDIVLDNSAPELNTYSNLIECTNVSLINVGTLKCIYRLDGRGYGYEKDFATPPSIDENIISSKYTIGDTVTSTYKNKETETFDVIYDANGGSGNMSESPKPYDVNYRLLSCQYTAPEGKQFKCWSVGGEEKAAEVLIGILGDTLITAVWEDVPQSTPIFISRPENQSGKIGAKISVPVEIDIEQVPDHSNKYILLEVKNGDNWDTVAECRRDQWTGAFTVTENTTGTKTYRYKAYDGTEWQKSDTFTVGFRALTVTFVDEAHSTAIPPVYVDTYGALLEKPADPTYPGDHFFGWKNSSNYQAWDFATSKVTDDTVLKAEWTDCGFTGMIPNVTVRVGEKAKIDLSNVSYNGVNTYLFVYDGEAWAQVDNITNYGGWNLGASAEAKTQQYKVIVGYNTWRAVESNVISVRWTDEAFGVAFNANGGEGEMQGIQFYGTYTLPDCAFTPPSGKEFKGWATSPSGQVIAQATYEVTEDVTFYAIWEKVQPKKITGITITSNMEFVVGGDIPLQLSCISVPSGAGYKASGVGWYDNTADDWAQGTFIIHHSYLFSIELSAEDGYEFGETGEITVLVDGKVAEVLKNGPKIMVRILYGEAAYYNVSFAANGGSGEMQALQLAGSYVLPECTFAPPVTGTHTYVFDCWSITGIGSKRPGETIVITEDKTVTAVWKEAPVSYTLSFDAGGGSGEMQSVIIDGGDYINLPECTFTPADEYSYFLHWDVSEVGLREADYKLYVFKDHVLTAVWGHKCIETPVDRLAPDCATETSGKEAHYVCNGCGSRYQDEGCEEKIDNIENWGVIAYEHDFTGEIVSLNASSHAYKCTNAGCEKAGNEALHNFTEWGSDTETHWQSCICTARGNLANHGSPEKQIGQDATCAADGWSDYYKCSCGRLYAEEACMNEIASLEEWKIGDGRIDASAHDFGAWASNGNGTHTRVCGLNAEHVETADCSGGTATCTERATCSVCNTAYGATLEHSYGTTWKTDANNHWKACECTDVIENAPHADGDGDGKCDACAYPMTPATPEKTENPNNPDNPGNTPEDPGATPPADNPPSDDEDGLGAGAIVAIVIGSVAVAGIGGFAIFWLVIKKKSFADLIAVFKTVFKKVFKKQ